RRARGDQLLRPADKRPPVDSRTERLHRPRPRPGGLAAPRQQPDRRRHFRPRLGPVADALPAVSERVQHVRQLGQLLRAARSHHVFRQKVRVGPARLHPGRPEDDQEAVASAAHLPYPADCGS
ncbi:hypothetical protein pipiens_000634, partial [Culex pipiens pipiens]